MSAQRIERLQLIPGRLPSIFDFFEDPANLEITTPRWLRFEMLSSSDPRVQEGTEIAYRLRWRGVPIRWRSRISEYSLGHRFVDEMLRGPYRRWHHTHAFRAVPGGVEMTSWSTSCPSGRWDASHTARWSVPTSRRSSTIDKR